MRFSADFARICTESIDSDDIVDICDQQHLLDDLMEEIFEKACDNEREMSFIISKGDGFNAAVAELKNYGYNVSFEETDMVKDECRKFYKVKVQW